MKASSHISNKFVDINEKIVAGLKMAILYQMKTLRIIFGSFLDMSKPSKKQTGT
jgi:hypothetical protein